MFLELLESITGIFVVVYDGQHALKYTLGRVQSVVGPGVHFKLPIIQKFELEETKHTTLDLEPQVIQLSDDLIYEVDAKVMYQIVDLRKAKIEIDDLVVGLQNRVVMVVQRVIQAQTRTSIRDVDAMIRAIFEELKPVEEQWGVRILQVGFSNLAPSPSTLEITQLDLLARERLAKYSDLRAAGLSSEACVALVTGAVVTTHSEIEQPTRAAAKRVDDDLAESIETNLDEIDEAQKQSEKLRKRKQQGKFGDDIAADEGEETGESE
ncbi:MAG: regulator of protease activity HflC (stomatin/prohibitin superfamily) [Planctomycetota bacterium]|jgi:regulator of protease activity HflC (stomatin/prohibitin superfamily)